MATLRINSVDLPAPKKISISMMDISEAERNAAGKMIIKIIRRGVRKLEIEWPPLTAAEMKSIHDVIKADSLTVVYVDPETNASKTIYCYKGDRSQGIQHDWAAGRLYDGLKVSLIEK